MEIQKISGRHAGNIFLYTLSTCGWCRRNKAWLKEQGAAHSFVDVDLAGRWEKEAQKEEVRRWNPSLSFPTTVVYRHEYATGFNPE